MGRTAVASLRPPPSMTRFTSQLKQWQCWPAAPFPALQGIGITHSFARCDYAHDVPHVAVFGTMSFTTFPTATASCVRYRAGTELAHPCQVTQSCQAASP